MIVVVIADASRRYLAKFDDERHIDEIKHLARSRKRKKAISYALSNAKHVQTLLNDECPDIYADLTLTSSGAYWDSA